MSAAPQPRLFFALWPTRLERARMAAAAAPFALEASARRVAVENYHMTVAFVGEVDELQAARLRRVAALSRAARFSVRFDAFEYWPKPQVVVAAAREIPPALAELWQDLHSRLAAVGFSLEPKRLRPHVSLAGKVAAAPLLPPMAACAWQAEELCLLRSASAAERGAYTVVDRWPLLDAPPQG